MTPTTMTKDKYSGKWIVWHLPIDKVVLFTSEGQSQVFWKCTSNFYLLGVGDTEKIAIANFAKKITDFTNWLAENHSEMSIDGISSNLPEYRQAIYEFNTKKLF